MSQTRWFAIAAALAIGLSHTSAHARVDAAPDDPSAAVKYTRTTGEHVPRQTLETRVKRAKQQAELDRSRKVQMIDAERYAKERTATEQSVADAQIVKLRQLVAVTEKDAPDLPELLLRLADLHLEKKVYFRRQADALYEQIDDHERAGRKPKARALLAKQKAFEKQADDASSAAVEVYQTLVTDRAFAKYKRLDEAIYFHAFELGELGRETDMQTAYLRLLREHPSSRYVPNALLTFADFYYGKDRITEALALYQKVVDGYPDSPVFAYALYKQAWCHLNPVGTAEPDYARSLDKFVKTIAATLEGRAGNERNAEQLRRDARRDLVRAFVHAGKPSRAHEFFREVGDGPNKAEDMSAKMMELLAAAYFGEGKYVESSATYKALQNESADAARRCDWQAKIVVNALASDDPAIQWSEAERLTLMGADVPLSKHGDRPTKACRNAAVDTLAQLATVWHDEADKTRKPASFALAEDAYAAFQLHFPEDPQGYELGYYHAELRWQTAELAQQRGDAVRTRAEFMASSELFRETLRRRPTGKHTREAALAQMLALKNAFGYDETAAPSRSCRTNAAGACIPEPRRGSVRVGRDRYFAETELTVAEGQMLHAYEVYQRYVDDPADPELPKILYHRLKLLIDHNRFSEAKPLAIELVTSRDGSLYSVWAAQMLVDALTIAWTDPANDDTETAAAGVELDRWGRKLQKLQLWKHEESAPLRERMPTLLAGIGWKLAIAEQDKGKAGDPQGYKNCANGFVDIWNEFDNHPEGDILLFNAARCFEAAFLVGRAIEMRKQLLAHYPESSKHEQTLEELGKGYQGIALFGEAAASFEGYASKYPRGHFAAEALGNAYLFRIGLGQQAEATADLDRYEEIYRRSDVAGAARIFWSKHALLQDDDQRLAHAREYLAKYGSKGGLDRQAVAEATIGQILWRRACAKPLMFDSCITVTRARATTGEKQRKHAEELRARIGRGRTRDTGPRYCGTGTQGLLTVHARDRKRVDEAMVHLQRVKALAAKRPSVPADDHVRVAEYRDAVGKALVYLSDREYERYLALAIPEGLYFGASDLEWQKDMGGRHARAYEQALAREQESLARVKSWFVAKDALAAELVRGYQQVKEHGSVHWVLAGAARAALVSRNFADQMYRAPIPEHLNAAQSEAYCDAFAVQIADPLAERAKSAFEYCLARSTEFQVFNEFSRMCEQELQQGDPEAFPATAELFGRASYTAARMDAVGVQVEGSAKPTRE